MTRINVSFLAACLEFFWLPRRSDLCGTWHARRTRARTMQRPTSCASRQCHSQANAGLRNSLVWQNEENAHLAGEGGVVPTIRKQAHRKSVATSTHLAFEERRPMVGTAEAWAYVSRRHGPFGMVPAQPRYAAGIVDAARPTIIPIRRSGSAHHAPNGPGCSDLAIFGLTPLSGKIPKIEKTATTAVFRKWTSRPSRVL